MPDERAGVVVDRRVRRDDVRDDGSDDAMMTMLLELGLELLTVNDGKPAVPDWPTGLPLVDKYL